MKSASAGLIAHLAASTTTLATCWKIKRTDGVILGFTDHDQDLSVDLSDGDGSITYASAVGYDRSGIRSTAEFKADNLEVIGFFDSAAITEADLRGGRYDFAEVKIFLVKWDDLSLGVLKLRRGEIGEVTLRDGQFRAELRGLIDRYRQEIGDLYQPSCRADLGDTKCGVRLDPPEWLPLQAYTVRQARDAVTGSVVKPLSFNDRHFKCTTAGTSGSGEPAWNLTIGGTTNDGSVVWTTIQALTIEAVVVSVANKREFTIDYTGSASETLITGGLCTILDSGSPSPANALIKREIKQFAFSPPTIVLFDPMPFTISVGDPVTLTAGCAKTVAACRDLFDNIENLRGEPYIPGNDLLFRTA